MAQPFSLTPALPVDEIYDFTSAAHSKVFSKATAPLKISHDGSAKTLRPFLNEVARRAEEFNMDYLLSVDDEGTEIHIIKESRLISMETIRATATTYMPQQNRESQDNFMLQKCMFDSLTPEGLQKLNDSIFDYKIEGYTCAPMLIKAFIKMCEVENSSTEFYVRQQMTELKDKMKEVNYNIREFNNHVTHLKSVLGRGGNTSDDLFMHVMLAYLTVKDKDFTDDIKSLKRKKERGERECSVEELLEYGHNAWLPLSTHGTYNKPTDEEQQIIALTAKLEQVAEERAGLDKKLSAFASRHTGKNATGGKFKGKRSDPKWMLQPPTNGKLTMTFAGEIWTWCPIHKKWGNHKEQDCRLKKKLNRESEGAKAYVTMEDAVAQAAISMYDSDDCDDDYF